MGIQGLLPALKSIMKPTHIRDHAGKRAAVDTYSWLHKAAFSCSKDLCQGRANDKYIEYCMHRVNMLRHFGVVPVLVFDGGSLPMKSDQEVKRARSRKENLERAIEHERLGNHSAASECYQKAVDITPQIAFRLIQVLRKENVEYVVAPYEADAQMAFLARNGHVDLVITEDSDLIAYECPQIFFKMDKYGQGVEFQYSDITANKDVDFSNFSKRMILELCIMSGCDYLPSLAGMGVKKAHGLIKRFKTYQKVLKHLKMSSVLIDPQYEHGFQRALLTFQHHLVYDPAKKEMVHLTQVPCELDTNLDFLGPFLTQTIAAAIAQGDMDPTTYKSFEDVSSTGAKIADSLNLQDLSVQKNVIVFQGSGKPAQKLFRVTSNGAFQPYVSQEDTTSSPATSSQAYSSSLSSWSLSCEQSPIFETPPSQVSEELNLDAGPTGSTPEYPLYYRRRHTLSELNENNKIVSSSTIEVKTRKAFVSPLLQNVAAQQTSGVAGYISRPTPSKLLPEDHHRIKRITDENSLWSTSKNTQDSDLADHSECNNDVNQRPDMPKKQGVLKDITNQEQSDAVARGKSSDLADHSECNNDLIQRPDTPKKQGVLKDITNQEQSDAVARGKRKTDDLSEERPMKSRILSSASLGGLAQRSVDEFMSRTAPFRCAPISSRPSWPPPKYGTRASGLRAPSKSLHKISTLRNQQQIFPAQTSAVKSDRS